MSGAGPDYSFPGLLSDYQNYQNSYNQIENINLSDSNEYMYILLYKLGNLLSLDFFAFRLLLIMICFFAIYVFLIKKYALNTNYILLMYLLYPMIIDSEHFQNFIAMTIFLVTVPLLKKSTLKKNILFLIMIIILSSLHTSFILYGFLIFVNAKEQNKVVKIIATFSIFLTVATLFNNNQIPFTSSIISIVENERIGGYLKTSTNLGFLIPITLHLTSVGLVYWSKKILDKKTQLVLENYNKNFEILNEKMSFVNLVFWINLVGIVYFPLFVLNLEFYRIVRNFLILNYIVYSLASNSLKKGSLYKVIFNIAIILSQVLWVILDLSFAKPLDRVLIPFFTENTFFN